MLNHDLMIKLGAKFNANLGCARIDACPLAAERELADSGTKKSVFISGATFVQLFSPVLTAEEFFKNSL